MKVIVKYGSGKEELVCESIDTFHGSLIVALLNQNYSSKIREVRYQLVNDEHSVTNEF